MKKFIITFIFMSVILKVSAFENNFFRFKVPETWEKRFSFKDNEPYPYVTNIFGNGVNEQKTSQIFYTYISKQIPDPKDIIYVHIERNLDKSGLEKLCSYSEENFHGFKALKYTFCGKMFGAYGRGIAYSFLHNGYVFLFFNFFNPNVFEKRYEYNVWDNLDIFPKEKWGMD